MSKSKRKIVVIDAAAGDLDAFAIVKIPACYLEKIGCAWTEYMRYFLSDREDIEKAINKLFDQHTNALRICQNEHLPIKVLDATLEKLREALKDRLAYVEENIAEGKDDD